MYEELTIKQDGKTVSLCFMNNDSFKKELDGKNEDELLELGYAIYESALKVLESSNKQYGILTRQMKKMDKDSVFYKIASRKLEKTNKTIESLNEAIDSLESDDDEFYWLKYMITRCIGTDNVNQDEE